MDRRKYLLGSIGAGLDVFSDACIAIDLESDAREQPKNSALVRIANDMIYSCRTGKALDDLDGQITKLLTVL
jgi:hypothetical protein